MSEKLEFRKTPRTRALIKRKIMPSCLITCNHISVVMLLNLSQQ